MNDCIDDDYADDDTSPPAIPSIVQRGLGMQNLKQQQHPSSSIAATNNNNNHINNYDNVICGLEGCLLPHYLSLRTGNGDNCMPEMFVKAQSEEIQNRQFRVKNNGTQPKASSDDAPRRTTKCCNSKQSTVGSRLLSKRKRKADLHYRVMAPENNNNNMQQLEDKDSMHIDEVVNNTNEKKRRKRRRRRPKRSSIQANDENGDNDIHDNRNAAASSSINNSDDWINHLIMARIIIAPFTPSLIATMNKCKKQQIEKEKQSMSSAQSSSQLGERHDDDNHTTTTTTTADVVVHQSTITAESLQASLSVVPTTYYNNVYQKKSISKNTNDAQSNSNNNSNSFLLKLSSPQESLESIVDGAVCTLVRRTHRYRTSSSQQSSSKGRKLAAGNSNSNKGKQIILYKRRSRRKRAKYEASVDSSNTNTSMIGNAKQQRHGIAVSNNNNNKNDWLLEQNLLSTGYTLGNGDTLTSSTSYSQQQQQQQLLRPCPNMAPGIHCIHPNTLTSYARSSSLMKCLHKMIGDDVVREILVNAIVLVPAIISTLESKESSSSSSSLFDRGNYFQLCGPPINKLAKKFNDVTSNSNMLLSTASLATTTITNTNVRKRKRNNVEEKNGEDSTAAIEYTAKEAANNADKKKDTTAQKKKKEERWDPNKPIPRGNLFYCDFYNKHVGLSPNHLLNQCDESNNDANVKLLNSMVQLWPAGYQRQWQLKSCTAAGVVKVINKNNNKRRGRWRRLRESGIAMCKEMRRRHKQCDYARLLERHCPLPTTKDSSTSANGSDSSKTILSHYVTLHTPVDNVGSFLEAVLYSALPNSFWGSIHNFHQAVRTMKVFTKLGRAEQLPEKAIVDGIRVFDMKWLLPNNVHNSNKDDSEQQQRSKKKRRKLSRSDHDSTTTLVRNVMRWLYRQFIIPLLRSTFYITETEFSGSRVLYYRRPVWSRIKSLSMEILLKQQYREMNATKARKVLSNHNVGCPPAPLRLLPKKTGIRAIAMLSKTCEVLDDDANNKATTANSMKSQGSSNNHLVPPNKVLQSTFHALKYEHEKKPTLFGAGVLGLTEVFPSFCSFVEALRQRRSNNNSGSTCSSNAGLYFASADIKHCYDTINQKHLLKLIKSVMEEDVYVTKNNFILHSKDNNKSLRCRWKKTTFSTDQFSRFLATSNALVEKCFNSIFVDGVQCSMEKKETITGLLRDHIFGQVVVASGNNGQRYLLQRNGIPQGSILSSMFCNIYFGNIEQYLLKDVFDKESSYIIRGGSLSKGFDVMFVQSNHDLHLLVRIVDDFLLISTCKDTSDRFLQKLNKGIPRLGVKINSDKSRVNYPLSLENTVTGEMEAVNVCQKFFPWCGLLINTTTCEISLDHERFCGSQAIDTVIIHHGGNQGLHLKKKMKDFVRPRCSQKLLFSSRINGIDTIRMNFYQTFLICATKLVHYLSGSGISSLGGHQQFIYSSACDTIHFAFLLISSKLKHGNVRTVSSYTNGDMGSFQLAWKDALWLGRHAFYSVFQRSGAQYAQLGKLFSECQRVTNPNYLLTLTRRTLKIWSLHSRKVG